MPSHVDALLIAATACVLARPASGAVYWTDRGDGAIRRAEADGSAQELLVTGVPGAQGIGIDCVEGHIFWADSTLLRISRANLDGSQMGVFLDGASQFTPVGLSVDAVNRMVYWTDPVLGRIQRAGLENPVPEDFQTGLAAPQDVAVDPILGRVYWTEGSAGIFYAPIAGGAPTPLVGSFVGSATVIAEHPVPCQVVWRAADRLSRADCLGIGVQDLVQSPGDVLGIAIDQASSAILWTDGAAGIIWRLDSGNPVPQPIITGLSMPWRLAVGPAVVPPLITTQPLGQAVENTGVATFSVEAIGAQPLSYAWFRDGDPLSDDGHVSGSGAAMLTIVASHADSGLYHCLVSNHDGATATVPSALAVRFCDSNGLPPPYSSAPQASPCHADLDADCDVDILDFALFSASYGNVVPAGATGDLDCDGIITVFDFAVFLSQFGCGQATP